MALFIRDLQKANLPRIGLAHASTVRSNSFGIGPFGTCSSSDIPRYTDTSSLPLGFEKAAIFASRIGESKMVSSKGRKTLVVANAMGPKYSTNRFFGSFLASRVRPLRPATL